MTEKISKIEAMYRYYKANPAASNGEVGQALGLSGDMVRTYKKPPEAQRPYLHRR